MSKLLINEAPLQVIPSLAKALGDVSEAIVLQQIHYWLNIPQIGKSHKGKRWVRNSVKQWQKENFCMWSERTIMRILHKLEEGGFIMSVDTLNNFSYDRTKWYTINYDKLAELEKQIEVEKLAEAEKEKAKRRKFSAEPQETDLPCDTLTPPDKLSPRTPDKLSPRTPDKLSVTIYRDSFNRESLTESVSAPAKTPAHFENFNALMGNGDIALSSDDRILKGHLVETIKGIVKDKTSLVKIYDLADTLLEKKITPAVLTKLFGAGGWWFTSCALNKAGLPPYVKNIVNELDTALATLEQKDKRAGVKVDLGEALSQLRGIAHLQNGQFSAAWGQLPQGVKEVLSSEAKRNGCKAVDLLGLELA